MGSFPPTFVKNVGTTASLVIRRGRVSEIRATELYPSCTPPHLRERPFFLPQSREYQWPNVFVYAFIETQMAKTVLNIPLTKNHKINFVIHFSSSFQFLDLKDISQSLSMFKISRIH